MGLCVSLVCEEGWRGWGGRGRKVYLGEGQVMVVGERPGSWRVRVHTVGGGRGL